MFISSTNAAKSQGCEDKDLRNKFPVVVSCRNNVKTKEISQAFVIDLKYPIWDSIPNWVFSKVFKQYTNGNLKCSVPRHDTYYHSYQNLPIVQCYWYHHPPSLLEIVLFKKAKDRL